MHVNVQGCLKRMDILFIEHRVLFLCVYIMQCIHYSSNKYLLNASYILGTALGPWDLAEGKIPTFLEFTFLGGGRQTINRKIIFYRVLSCMKEKPRKIRDQRETKDEGSSSHGRVRGSVSTEVTFMRRRRKPSKI